MKYVCAAVAYMDGNIPIHSDACPPGCLAGNMGRDEWRKFIHASLDEWLDNSGGTGYFAIGGERVWDALNLGADL